MNTVKDNPISKSVQAAVDQYLDTLSDRQVNDLHELVMDDVERTLIHCVLVHTGRNQSQAASILGISRGTLRKKVQKYRLL